MGFLSDLVSGLTGYKDAKRAVDRQRQLREDTYGKYTDTGESVREGSQFRPFSVMSSQGRVDATPEGGLNFQLSPEQQALQDRLFGSAGSFLDQLGGDPIDRAGALYEQLRAIQRPEEQRRGLDLENRLRAQGRGGLRIGAFGGTPEQLANAIANEDSRNKALFQAYGQAQQDQRQAGGMLAQLLGLGDSRQKALNDLARLGLQGSQIAQRGQLAGEQGFLTSMLQGIGQDALFGQQENAMLGKKDDARSNFFNNLFG